MKWILTMVINYLRMDLSIDDVRDGGLFLIDNSINKFMQHIAVPISYIIVVVVVRSFVYILEVGFSIDVLFPLYICLAFISFLSEFGMVAEMEAILKRQLNFLLRTVCKLFFLLILDGVIVKLFS